MARFGSEMGQSLRSLARKVSLWRRNSRSTVMLESFTKVTVFDAGLPSIGVDPKSICSFYILRLGIMAEPFIRMSIFFDPLTIIVAEVSMLQGLSEVTLKTIYVAYSAAMLPLLGEGMIKD